MAAACVEGMYGTTSRLGPIAGFDTRCVCPACVSANNVILRKGNVDKYERQILLLTTCVKNNEIFFKTYEKLSLY
jgi:hypothetical protein